jgi:hypothetical protein
MRCSSRLSWLIVIVVATTIQPALGDDAKRPGKPAAAKAANDKAFQKVKREFQQKIRNKKPAERIAALKLLEEFPTGDAADLVYVTVLDDKSDDVRTAAVEFIKGWRDREAVTARILQRMTNATRKDPMDIRAMGGLRALAGAEDDDSQRQVLAYLDEFLGTPQANQYLLHEMIDEESPVGDAEDVLRMLALFTRAQFFDRHFGYRRCVMQGMMQVKSRNAISHLINLLPRLKGLVQFDVVTHLIKSTGQNFADDAAKWKAWWAQNQRATQLPEKPKIPPVANYGKLGEYYGIPICAKRIVFVLDTSGSMRGGRLEAAKVELIRAIKEIPKEVSFSIVIFNSTVRVWQRELVPANESMKQIAVNVVLEQEARNDTATYDALEAAFDLEPEAIYLLSDGAPQGGKIDNPAEIVASVSTGNRVRRLSIHSIGIDTRDVAVSPFARFMKGLAEANWGEFRSVD